MGFKKANQFWKSVNNISQITKLINEKRKANRKSYFLKEQDQVVMSTKLSKEHNLISLRGVLKNEKIFELFGHVVNDMYKFDFINSSSVDFEIQKRFHNDNDLDALANVNLLEHTFGVVNEMNLIVNKSYGQIFDFYMLAALIHDFGKSPQLRNHYCLTTEGGHHKASAEYLERKKEEIKDSLEEFEKEMIDNVIGAIKVHHDEDKKIPNLFDKGKENDKEREKETIQEMILKFLKKADATQRKKELKALKE